LIEKSFIYEPVIEFALAIAGETELSLPSISFISAFLSQPFPAIPSENGDTELKIKSQH